jgi:hypothetical protein
MTDQKLNSLKDDKDQALFKRACEKILGRDWYQAVRAEAAEAYKQAVNSTACEVKKRNAGLRAGNLIMLSAIAEAGVSNWRQFIADSSPSQGYADRAPVRTQEPPKPFSPNAKQPKRDGSSLDKMMMDAANNLRSKRK